MNYVRISFLIIGAFFVTFSSSASRQPGEQSDREYFKTLSVSDADYDLLRRNVLHNQKIIYETKKEFVGPVVLNNVSWFPGRHERASLHCYPEITTSIRLNEGEKVIVDKDRRGFYLRFIVEKPLRLMRLDGQGFGKEGLDGSVKLGTFQLNNSRQGCSLMTLGEEVQLAVRNCRQERLPENAQGRPSTFRKKKAPAVPSTADMERIRAAAHDKNKEVLVSLEQRFKRIDDEVREKYSDRAEDALKKFSFIRSNMDKTDLVERILSQLLTDINKLEEANAHFLKAKNSGSRPNTGLYYSSGSKVKSGDQKKQAALKLQEEELRKALHDNRPNANPAGAIVEEQEEVGVPVIQHAYTFQKVPEHPIIKVLADTAEADSSYDGITISREQLMSFISFLEQQEAQLREGEIQKPDDLGYYYSKDKGKGSHVKFCLGFGTKPVVLSNKSGSLKVYQLKDLKDALIEKGLIVRKD